MNEFYQLVKDMRNAQRKYFHSRSNTALREAKDLEERVDNFIKQKEEQPKQMDFF